MPGRHWSAGLVVVGVALLLSAGQSQDTCGGQDGRPGEAGVAGRNGWPGPKGEKGEPAPVHAGPSAVDPSFLLRLKGERGSRGFPGETGLKGLSGEVGPEGTAGLSGPPGPPGAGGRTARQSPSRAPQSAFSVVRTLHSYPEYDRPIIFQTEAVNRPGDMDLSTGYFTCTVPGLYYFVFHAMSKVSMCLRLKSEALGGVHDLGFCDFNTRRRAQVLSGGVVLQLTQNQRVWLEAFKDGQLASHKADTQEKEIVFNGFLIF